MPRADMKTLQDIGAAPGVRAQVVSDCSQLVDDEVKRKSGLSGLAIKGAYALVKAIKPGIIRESIEHLLDGFVAQLEPFYVRAQDKNEKLGAVLMREARRRETSVSALVRDAIGSFLGLTDTKPRRLAFAAIGRSGRRHTSRDAEKILAAEWGRARGR